MKSHDRTVISLVVDANLKRYLCLLDPVFNGFVRGVVDRWSGFMFFVAGIVWKGYYENLLNDDECTDNFA